MRKYYIDNIRNLAILMLFPYHTCMIYNGFESFYIHGSVIRACNDFILITSLWFMPLLFFLAGVSSYWALQKRTVREYLRERFFRLLVPFFLGIILIVPVQTYYAEKFHNHYRGSFFEQYVLFFTKSTDLSGYNGGFTPGHLWFLLYLFIISLIALPLMIRLRKSNRSLKGWLETPRLELLFILPFIASAVLDISGKSLGQSFALFMLGFGMGRQEDVFEKVERNRRWYLALTLVFGMVIYIIYYTMGWESGFSPAAIAVSGLRHLIMWLSMLTILGYGKRYLNKPSSISAYFTKAVFPIYVFHQSWLVLIAYYVFQVTDYAPLQILSIMLLSFAASILTYEALKRISITRGMFGIKK